MDGNLQEKIRATLEGRSLPNPNLFNAPITKSVVKGFLPTVAKIPDALAGAEKSFRQGTQDLKQQLPDWAKPFTPFVRGADLAKTLVQETAAGGVSLIKSAQELSGAKAPQLRSPFEKQQLEQKLFGREIKSIQEQYLQPAQQFAEEKGSGAVEKFGLGAGAVGAGIFAESPFGRLFPKSRGIFRSLIKNDVDKLASEVDPKIILKTLAGRGIDTKAFSDSVIKKIANATTVRQVNRALDEAEVQLVKDAELAKTVSSRVKAPAPRPRTDVIPLRQSAGTSPSLSTAGKVDTSVNPEQIRQTIKDKVRATLEEERLVKSEVLPPVRDMATLNTVGRDTVAFTVDAIKAGDGLVPKNIENNFRTIAGELGLNTDKKLKQLVEDVIKKLDELPTNKRKQFEVPENYFFERVSVPSYLRNNRQAGFASLPDGFKKPKQTQAARDVVNKINKPIKSIDDVINRDATGPAGRPVAGEAPSAKQAETPQQQAVPLPTKTTTNSGILSSLSKSNPKQAQKASQEYTAYTGAVDKVVNSKWLDIREKGQDAFIRMRKLQQKVANGAKIPDDINVDQAETLFHGRVNAKLEDIGQKVREVDSSIVAAAKKTNVSADEFRTDVDSYLHALHAPERNAKLGDGAAGITNADAAKTVQALKDTGRFADVKEQADKLLELNRQTLDILLEGQLIDEATHKLLRDTYKNHVPLMRIMDESANLTDMLTGKGFDVKSSGLKKAKGSDKEVANITGNIVQAVEQAIIRSEKNLVNLTTARWARANKDLGVIKEIKPRAIGKTFDEQGAILEDLSQSSNVITFFEGGKKKFLEVQDDSLAKVLKGINVENVPTLFRGVAFLTRLYGQLHTRFNYEFAFSNAVRDVQEMAVDMSSRSGMGFGGAGKSAARVPQSQKAVTDFILGRDTEGARLYQQMRNDGGTTGGLGLSSRQEIDMELQRIQKLNQSNPRKAAEAALRAIDNWNRIFEDGTRLAVYKTALDRGLSRKEAAVLAKESTINFNKKGTSGPLINGLWMFSNASIQGTTKVLRAMKNPKVAAAVTASMFAAVESANQWNDSVDPEWRQKVSKWDRSANLVIVKPTDDGSIDYFTIPISWGLKPIKMTIEYMSDLTKGEIDPIDGMQGILVSVLQSYNPLAGDESLLRTLTPTVLKTPVEISSNRGWHGNMIKPAYDVNAPASSQYFPSLADSVSGRASINLTEALSRNGVIELSPADVDYAFNQYIGGVGRSVNKLSTMIAGIGDDEPLPANQRPVLSRFFKTREQEQVFANLFYSRREQADKEKAAERVLEKRRVQPIYEEVQLLVADGKTQEAQMIVDELSDDDYEVYKKLKATDMRRANVSAQIEQYSTVRDVEQLVADGDTDGAQRIVESLTDEEYEAYQKAKATLGVEF